MNSSKRRLLAVAIVVVAAAASVVAVSTARGSQSRSLAGGTYRVGWEIGWKNDAEWGEGFWSDGFDPTGESSAFGIYTNLLVRTLVGYNHVAGAAGYKLVPDLATRVPTPQDGGRTYSFTLESGVEFGPPVNRAITSKDIRYAIERLARPKNAPPRGPVQGGAVRLFRDYALYFDVIQGFNAYRTSKAKSIAGIVTPNAKTITFHLTRPTGDFLHRLTLPAAAPIPPEVGKCFEAKPGKYGADLISSGPYMIEGSDAIDISSCGAIRPMRGISDTQLILVRNPSYDAKTDSTAARENNPDRFVFVGGLKAVEIVKRMTAGELDDAVLTSSPRLLGPAVAAARKRGLLRVNSADWLFYISMNLTKPPFDDVHVRRAMSWVMDKAALQDAWGGPLAGPIAGHIVPDGLLENRLEGFAPFETQSDQGDLAKAKAEMAKSKYASAGGVCTASACKRVHLKACCGPITYAAGQRMPPIIEASAAKIGITFGVSGGPDDLASSTNRITFPAHWIPDVSDPGNFFEPLLTGASITRSGNRNYSFLGVTPAAAARLGVSGNVKSVPSVDADIARCGVLTGPGRVSCYATLDRKLSTEIVPWIPFLWRNQITILGPQVAKWAFDQSTGVTGFAHVAVKG